MIQKMQIVRAFMANDGFAEQNGTIDGILQQFEIAGKEFHEFSASAARQMVTAANPTVYRHVAPNELFDYAYGSFIDGFLTIIRVYSQNGRMPQNGLNQPALAEIVRQFYALKPNQLIQLVSRRISPHLIEWATKQRTLRCILRIRGINLSPGQPFHIGNGWEHVQGVLGGSFYMGMAAALILNYEEVPTVAC